MMWLFQSAVKFGVYAPGMVGYATIRENLVGIQAAQGAVAATADPAVFEITLGGSETLFLGTLQVIFLNGVGAAIGGISGNVVRQYPGDNVQAVVGNVGGNVVGAVGSIAPAGGVTLAGQVWNLVDGIELGLTPRGAMRCQFAVLAGVTRVPPATPAGVVAFRNFGNTKDRVYAQTAGQGSRPTVTYDLS